MGAVDEKIGLFLKLCINSAGNVCWRAGAGVSSI